MKVLYFAWIREKTGIASEELGLPDEVATVGELAHWLKSRGGGYSEVFGNPETVRVAVNQNHVHMSHAICDADEVAFFPPVTGG